MDAIPVTQILSNYAKSPEVNFYGRFLWLVKELKVSPIEVFMQDFRLKRDQKPPKLYYNSIIPLDWTSCCVKTNAIIMIIFFGIHFEKPDALISLSPNPRSSIIELKSLIRSRENTNSVGLRQSQELLDVPKKDGLDEDHWTVYSISIRSILYGKKYNVHALTLLQANVGGTTVLKIYQSYANQYSFKDNLLLDETISRDDLFVMLDMIEEFVTCTCWCSEELFTRFFKAVHVLPKNEPLNPRELVIRYGNVSRSDLIKNDIKYAAAFPMNRAIKFQKTKP